MSDSSSVEEDTVDCPRKRQKLNDSERRLDSLEEELQKYIRKEPQEPSLFLEEEGFDSVVDFLSDHTFRCSCPMFLRDIFILLLKAVLGRFCPFNIRSLKLEVPHRIRKTVVFEVDGLTTQDVYAINSELNTKCDIFSYVFEIVSSNTAFATELSTLHMASSFYNNANEYYSTLFPTDKTVKVVENPYKQSMLTKLHLLLTPVQLAMEKYPLPIKRFELSRSANYTFTKELYSPVTINSPMFALDCEMVKVESGVREVAHISLVNENLEVVYNTLVMPDREILNYVTEYSGITEEMLRNVTVRLSDVQRDLKRILPPDAILCGQSLNFDLHALRLIHPYVIDTSIIFQDCKLRKRKKSLKKLTKFYLNEDIQTSEQGHDPNEDAMATMKLIQLRLKNSAFSYKNTQLASPISNQNTCEVKSLRFSHDISKFYNFVRLSTEAKDDGFFPRLSRSSKSVCLIGSADAFDNYYSGVMTDNVTHIYEDNLKGVSSALMSNIQSFDCIISHVKFDKENNSLDELNAEVKDICYKLPKYSIFLNYISGVGRPEDNSFKHNICMAKVKK